MKHSPLHGYKRIVLLLSFFGCLCFPVLAQQQVTKGFTIKGHISGIEDGTPVYLFNIDEQANIDTAIATDGLFTFSGSVSEPTICWVLCKDQYTIIQVENVTMEFESPLVNMRLDAAIKGGREQDLWNEMAKKQYPYDKVFFSAYDTIMKKMYANETDRKRLVKLFDTAQATSQGIYIDFGKQHPDSYLGMDILYRNREKIGKDSITILYSQISDPLKLSIKGKALKQFIYGDLVEKGKHFIDFTAETTDGRSFTLSSLRGNYILLSFWDAGCVPCRKENKKISERYNELVDKIHFVSFSIDKNKTAWLKASKEDNISWTNVSDMAGDKGKIKTQYEVQALPTAYLINKEGFVVEKFIGFDADFLDHIEKLLL